MARRRSIWDHMKWDLLALLFLGALVLGYTAIQDPTLQPAESPQTDGSKPPDRTEGDILLVVPTAPAARATNYDTLDCSFSWYNALWHYYGTFATAPSDTISPQLLAGHAVVIVSARVASEMSSSAREDLAEFARSGGQLIVELPRQGWEPITGISTVGEIGEARTITSVEGLGVYDERRDHLLEAPVTGKLLPVADLEARPTGPVIFEVEEQPGLVVESLGEGKVYSLLFEFGCSLTAMHQGKPTRDLEFGPPEADRWLPSARRVGYEQLLATPVPYADILQRSLFDRLPEARPMARLWPYPGHYMGAAMTIHPAETNPRAAFGYADRARKMDAQSTIFAAPDRFSNNHSAMAEQIDADVGLLWVLGQERPPVTEGVGIGALEPWARELNLPRQQAMLAAARQSPSIHQVRTEGALWENDWDSTFRTLAGAGFTIDASFGPSDADEYGYLFGTTMPFYPLDRRGTPIPILEAPFVLEASSLSSSRLRQIYDGSASGFHQPLMLSVGADAMERSPSAGLMLGFRQFHDLAREYDHWLTTLSDYVDFLGIRRQSVVTSQWSVQQRRLTVSVNLLGGRLATAPDGAVASVAIPNQYDGYDIERIEVDDDPLSLSATVRSGHGEERLLDLDAGRHVISVFYEGPPEEEDPSEVGP